MEFPFGHHHHHGRRDDEEEGQRYPPPGQRPFDAPPPPPPCYDRPGGEGYGRPGYPPPPTHHVSHEVGYGYEAPRPYPGAGYGEGGYSGHHNHPPYSSGVHPVGHESWGGGAPAAPRQPTVRIFTKAEENYSLSIRDGNVILAPANPRDEYQHWIKDMRYATKVKDQEGFPSFALVNKVTGEAIKHSLGATHPVRLIRYNPDYLDESVLWTESADTGEGFRCIRMVNNIGLNFDAFHGDKDHGGVHDGTTVVLWEWLKGKNQRWRIVPY
ncbi:ricin B-like lectin R40G3 [Elaeis guineensis]|uniref:Ricin B-like lectin R40G3 n=1 Tax=Elaeis guineensis var. tenera TaxID=51953 RepID=A0A6I9R6L8_ELAGV|nr:ricin B-like lectin R40G3 [Elaeis guineensis]